MLSPDEMSQTTAEVDHLPRTLDRRSVMSEKRQILLQHKQTDMLPSVPADTTPNAKVAWRQVMVLREENRRLRFELEEQQTELQHVLDEYSQLQTSYDQELPVIHSGYQQEVTQYQTHLQELMEERNRLQEMYGDLERQYQDLYNSFQTSIEEEAQKMLVEATQTTLLTPDQAPPGLFQDVVKTLELQVRQEEDKHLVEAIYLRREIQHMADHLEQERREIEAEKQQLFVRQHSVREQAALREKVLRARLHSRWKVATVVTSIGLLIVLVILQFAFLALLHVRFVPAVSLAILAPILLCTLLAIFLETPFVTMLKHVYKSVPHKKKTGQL